MLTAIVIIIIGGALFSHIFEKCKLPGLIGMICFGILIGPDGFNWLPKDFLAWSSELRQLALVIILFRAGLTLNIKDLKQNSWQSIMMCFVPASFEIIGIALLAPYLFNLPLADSLVLGTVLAAVSPAIIVPRMIDLIQTKWGTEKGIPQMILAGSSADDIFVIILFSAFLTMAQTGVFHWVTLVELPVSIITGLLIGYLISHLFAWLFKFWHPKPAITSVMLLGFLYLLVANEETIQQLIPYSALLSVFAFGLSSQHLMPEKHSLFSDTFSRYWDIAQILLFVLVGTTVRLTVLQTVSFKGVILLFGALFIRSIGVMLATTGARLSWKERVFTVIAYLPKATVQAAIGATPLAVGLQSGEIILAIAVLAILITAPIGAFLIDLLSPHLLTQTKDK